MTRLPPRSPCVYKKRICIVCEGAEEYEYIKALRNLRQWDINCKIDVKCADGIGNIPAVYQDVYLNGEYDLVLVKSMSIIT